jgi:hypothetical protein
MKPFSILMIRLLGLYLFLKTLFSMLPALLGPNVGEFWSAELLPVLIATGRYPWWAAYCCGASPAAWRSGCMALEG